MPEILLCGAEGEQFLFENALTIEGADDKRRGSVVLTAGQQMFRQFSTSYNDFWVHFRCAPFDQIQANRDAGVLMTVTAGTTLVARVSAVASGGNTVNFTFDAASSNGTMITGPMLPHPMGEFINYDIRIQTAGTTRTVSFYRNEVLRYTVSYEDIAWTAPDSVLFQSRTNDADEDDMHYQDIIITDALPTVGMELATLVPSAVGNFSDFTNDYTAIDDFGYDQSTVMSTTTANTRESWFFADPEFRLGDKVIYGVAVTTVAQLDLVGVISDFVPFLHISSVSYPGRTLSANSTAPNAYTTVFKVNPVTTLPWEEADLVGLESGIHAV